MADSGGGRSTDIKKWKTFVGAAKQHIEVLDQEFLYDNKRCQNRFSSVRRKQAALMRIARFVVRKEEGTPILIGVGNGNFPAATRGCTISVPTKRVHKSIKAAFKQHRKTGFIFKVWEHRTTLTCHKCFAEMEKEYKTKEDGSTVEDRDFRRFNHCENGPKVRNRDFNAAKNILLAFLAFLEDKERPEHLCRVKRTCDAAVKSRRKSKKRKAL